MLPRKAANVSIKLCILVTAKYKKGRYPLTEEESEVLL